MVMKIAFDGLHDSAYRTRDNSICDVGNYERIELNVVLCDDDFIRKLNNDKAADVLSISRHIPNLDLPIVSRPTIYSTLFIYSTSLLT